MRKLMILFLFFCFACLSNEAYNVYNWRDSGRVTSDVPTIFIFDYSNSMNERINGVSKYRHLLNSFGMILGKIPETVPVGVRIYGHRWGITNADACRASILVEGLSNYNRNNIVDAISKYRARGMTPITYSLKQTIEKDFPKGDYKKHIVLVTDGGENCDGSPCEYAIELVKQRKDIKIDVIAINVGNEEDIDQLACTANVTGGKIYEVETSAELLRSLEDSVAGEKEVNAQILR